MKLLKWLSVADRFAKSYLDDQLAPLGINSSQHMYLLKICDQPGILQDSLPELFLCASQQHRPNHCASGEKRFFNQGALREG